jgi:putative tricarboxylic transport membrane protein
VKDRVIPRLNELLPYWKTIIRSGLIGTIIGIIPGVGEDVAAWVSYDFAKRASKHPETFGKGEVEGLIAAETGNNACIGGAIIPVLSLAVPGSAPAAVLLGAMFIHGVRPGPTIMMENPFFVYQVTAMFTLATFAMGGLGLTMIRPLVKVLQVPRNKLMPIVFTLCAIGAYAISSRTFDIGVMVVFGLIGFVLRQMDYPMAPLILGLILGDLLDKNLRRALTLGNGDISLFFQGPIDLFLIGMILFVVISRLPWVQSYFLARRAAKTARKAGA